MFLYYYYRCIFLNIKFYINFFFFFFQHFNGALPPFSGFFSVEKSDITHIELLFLVSFLRCIFYNISLLYCICFLQDAFIIFCVQYFVYHMPMYMFSLDLLCFGFIEFLISMERMIFLNFGKLSSNVLLNISFFHFLSFLSSWNYLYINADCLLLIYREGLFSSLYFSWDIFYCPDFQWASLFLCAQLWSCEFFISIFSIVLLQGFTFLH